jgi:hypothetical protein
VLIRTGPALPSLSTILARRGLVGGGAASVGSIGMSVVSTPC